ncbi:hypothetical protein BU16DRAFT_96273 [Lophium mytilinum]|uniref:Uncharacterized protein n=1 Tax=Lophium mytilinum TaxID=390894 RepID=A0A6A6QL96_9PEZI|nr:hypothetical protein BU16DRAFT_96273 [Lophium mytilinum]
MHYVHYSHYVHYVHYSHYSPIPSPLPPQPSPSVSGRPIPRVPHVGVAVRTEAAQHIIKTVYEGRKMPSRNSQNPELGDGNPYHMLVVVESPRARGRDRYARDGYAVYQAWVCEGSVAASERVWGGLL